MKKFGVIALLLLGLVTKAQAQSEAREPYQWVRTLESVLEEIAHGSDAAQIYLPKLIETIADEIEATDPKILVEKRNTRAILVYALSGGDSRAIRKLLGTGQLQPPEDEIAKGALAYSEGKYAVAANHLMAIDARTLDASVAPRLALTQAILIYKNDPKKAITLLDQARLLATGTLVEESAMRRQVVLLGAEQDFDRFRSLSQRYLRKFGDSLYAGYFATQFSLAVALFDFAHEKERLAKLKEIVDSLEIEARRLALYLMMAENAIGLGNITLAKFAAEHGHALSDPASGERARADLYLAAADVASVDAPKAMATLNALRDEELKDTDATLRDIALAVGTEVEREPVLQADEGHAKLETTAAHAGEHPPAAEAAEGAPGSEGKNTGESESGTDQPEKDEVEQAARKALAEADKILGEGNT